MPTAQDHATDLAHRIDAALALAREARTVQNPERYRAIIASMVQALTSDLVFRGARHGERIPAEIDGMAVLSTVREQPFRPVTHTAVLGQPDDLYRVERIRWTAQEGWRVLPSQDNGQLQNTDLSWRQAITWFARLARLASTEA